MSYVPHALRPEHLKLGNKIAVLRHVRHYGISTKSEISRAIGLSRPTTSAMVDELLAESLLRTAGFGTSSSSGGKRPQLLEFNEGAGSIVAIYLGIERIQGAVTDLGASIQQRYSLPTGAPDGPEAVIDRLESVIDHLLARTDRMIGIGVGVPGLVDPRSGHVHFSPNFPGWRDIPLGALLRRRYPHPVLADNECRVKTLAEKWFGAGIHAENLICVETDVGIGAGIIIDSRLYCGVDGSAGEVGHTTLDPDGPLCHCGNRGCWEALASSRALEARVRDRLARGDASVLSTRREQVNVHDIVEAALAGDPLARQCAVYENGSLLGLGIANIANAFNTQMVIVQGEIVALGEPLRAVIEDVVRSRALAVPARRMEIHLSKLGRDVGVVGASALVLRGLFSHELAQGTIRQGKGG